MNRLAARVAGFAIPTVALVIALHLKEQASWGEGIDGLVSGVCFALPFAAFSWLRSRFEGQRSSALARGPGREFAFGMLAAAVAWLAVWLAWTLPSTRAWRPYAFAINLVAMAIAGLLLPPAGRAAREHTSRGESSPLSETAP